MLPGTTIFTRMTALAEETGAINLGQGFPDFDGPAAVIEAAVEAVRAGRNQYAPLAGVRELREAIAEHQSRHYGLVVDPDREIQVTFGATEALAAGVLGLVARGEEVAFLDPAYDSYAAIVALAGGRARRIVLEPPAWRLTESAVEAGIGRETRVVVINSPHNPTGRVFDREELELVAAACRKHDVIALTDEVYEHIVFDGRHLPLAGFAGMAERTVTVSSVGKTFSVTGWKVGWASGPAELIGRLREVKQFLTFAGGTPLQYAAAAALGLPESVAQEMAGRLADKRDRLTSGLRSVGFGVLPSAATYFVNAETSGLGEEDAAGLCGRLPHEAGVVGIPTSAFAGDPEGATRGLIRFAFPKGDAVLDEAVARLGRWAAGRA